MSTITVTAGRDVPVPVGEVYDLLADYRTSRPHYLPDAITDYRVLEGDETGLEIAYRLHATKKRVRPVRADVIEQPERHQLIERTEDADLRVVWRVAPGATGSRVDVTISWTGAGGVAGVAERVFAPIGMRRIYGQMLDRLTAEAARRR